MNAFFANFCEDFFILNTWSRLIVIESVEINSLKDSIDVRIVIKIKMLFT